MHIITWIRDRIGVHVAYTSNSTSKDVKTESFPAAMSDAEVLEKLGGAPAPKKEKPAAPPAPEELRKYPNVPDDIAPDESGKEEDIKDKSEMLRELAAAGIKGWNAAGVDKIREAYNKAKAEGKLG